MRFDAPEVQGLSTCEDRRQVQTELGEGPSMNVVFKMGGQPRELPGLLTTFKVKIAAKAEKAKTMGISDVKYLSPAINSCSAGFEQQVIVVKTPGYSKYTPLDCEHMYTLKLGCFFSFLLS